jgi:hypothetical protein
VFFDSVVETINIFLQKYWCNMQEFCSSIKRPSLWTMYIWSLPKLFSHGHHPKRVLFRVFDTVANFSSASHAFLWNLSGNHHDLITHILCMCQIITVHAIKDLPLARMMPGPFELWLPPSWSPLSVNRRWSLKWLWIVSSLRVHYSPYLEQFFPERPLSMW